MKKFLALSIAAFTLAFAVPQALSAADDAATIKKNMAERKPKIEDADKKIVEDENKDRKAVYTDIAKQQSSATGKKVSVEMVAETRAKKLRSLAKEGEFIQGEDGKWIKAPKPAEKPAEKKEK